MCGLPSHTYVQLNSLLELIYSMRTKHFSVVNETKLIVRLAIRQKGKTAFIDQYINLTNTGSPLQGQS